MLALVSATRNSNSTLPGTLKSVAGKVKKLFVRMKPMPVGSTPYRPPPPPPPKWYEKWYVWAGAAGAVAAVTVAIVVPVVVTSRDPIADFGPEYHWPAKPPDPSNGN